MRTTANMPASLKDAAFNVEQTAYALRALAELTGAQLGGAGIDAECFVVVAGAVLSSSLSRLDAVNVMLGGGRPGDLVNA